MHDRGQRRGGEVHHQEKDPGAVPRARETRRGTLRGISRLHEEPRLQGAAFATPEAARAAPDDGRRAGPARRLCHQHGAAQEFRARRVHAGQHRPLRPRARSVRTLHVADPPLPGPARASRDPAHDLGRQGARLPLQRRAHGAARQDHVGTRAPRRRCDARGRGAAEVPVHGETPRRSFRRADLGGHALRPVRADRRAAGRRPRARVEPQERLLRARARPPAARRQPHRPGLCARRRGRGHRRPRRPRDAAHRLRALRASPVEWRRQAGRRRQGRRQGRRWRRQGRQRRQRRRRRR